MSTTVVELTTTGVEAAESPPTTAASQDSALQKGTTVIIFASVTGVTGISSLLAGLVTVTLPKMAKDLELSESLLLWYVSARRNGQLH